MEYSVGSLADLISGQNTPNKPKIVKVPIKKEKKSEKQAAVTDPTILEGNKKKDANSTEKSKKRKAISDQKIIKAKHLRSDESTLADDVEETLEDETENNSEPEKKKKKVKRAQDPEELERTIFVGNVPIKTEKKKIKQHFKKYGLIESLRFRGIPVADPKVSKKVAAIKKEYHPSRNSVYCYIRFLNKEDAQKSLAENGGLFGEHHLRVHSCSAREKPDESKAIFIGNLSFDAEEEELWKLFETCGAISNVRIVRNSYTGMGKGFAYVNFQDSDSVQLALEMEDVTLRNRVLRISLSSATSAKKRKNFEKRISKRTSQSATPRNGQSEKPHYNGKFQGSKANINKKRKMNGRLQDKKRKIKEIAPFPQ